MLWHAVYLCIAYVVDRIVGDPRVLVHPVIIIGKCISLLERLIRRITANETLLKLGGCLFPLCIAGGAWAVTAILLHAAGLIHQALRAALEIWLISTTIAAKGLGDAGMEVYRHLKNKDLYKARQSLGMIVGRDTERLDEGEVSRGAVETVAENIVDAVISPLFYALIGGAPLAMLYRAANTLDSMVGYKNERYGSLGWASARFDDVLNYIPARLTAFCMLLACWVKRMDVKSAWRVMIRDAKGHPSPNSGIPESFMAGALHVQLGGTNFYNGVPSKRAKMGNPIRRLEADDIMQTVNVMKITATICVFLFLTASLLAAQYIHPGR